MDNPFQENFTGSLILKAIHSPRGAKPEELDEEDMALPFLVNFKEEEEEDQSSPPRTNKGDGFFIRKCDESLEVLETNNPFVRGGGEKCELMTDFLARMEKKIST